ncbi:5-carboxymethyl-2-hydroxymuconate Delta-isomerase [Heyndrickxia coagulans]|uniref:5-carboxymethyl-2-hydroxymuconate Delta-isomerase n=1 Tax=Heyndrickxia TaxID=2837504 RepID=UPI000779A34B|nr:5-carboxymethyl-2-hydroxymuconate Delta-isomerase [Heyndrickxia coagulans]KYC62101.1 5-carboxymethyl-2-hydroxymuconate delta-isomerase [Heyndrickxia coagulans]
MPHFIVEYTDNIKQEADISGLLKKVNQVLISMSPVFPIGGIRSRAIPVQEYVIADGEEEYAFVHATLKIGSGRPEEVKKEVCDELFSVMKKHFSELYNKRYLALSLELYEFSEAGTYKYNNIHTKFK